MVYKCEVQNHLGNHLYLRGQEEEVYDVVDQFFIENEYNMPMIIEERNRGEDIFVHLMYTPPNLYCEVCDVCVNSTRQMEHHIKGKRHHYNNDTCIVL